MAFFPAIVKNYVIVAKICKYALYKSSEGFCCGPQKPANPCHPDEERNEDERYVWSDCSWNEEWGWKICRGHLIRLLLAGVDRSLDNQSDRLHQRMQGKAEMAADWQRKLGLFWSYATGRSNAMYWCCCLVLPHKEHMAWPHKATSMPTPQQSQTRKKISWGYWYQDIDLTIVIFWNLHYK